MYKFPMQIYKSSTQSAAESGAEMECAICMEMYNKPKLLFCMHTFCEGCIKKLACTEADDRSVVCPICRRETKVGRNLELLWDNYIAIRKIEVCKLSEMKTNGELYCTDCDKDLAVDFCHDCRLRLCEGCSSYHLRSTRFNGHTIENINDIPEESLLQCVQATCRKHKLPLKYYCETCRLPSCSDCTLSKVHQSHSFRLIEETIEEDIESLKAFIPYAKQQKGEYESYLKKAGEYLEAAEKTKKESSKVVEETFKSLFEVLEKQKKHLLQWLDAGYLKSKNSYNKARDDARILGLTVNYLEDMLKNSPREKVSQILTEGSKKLQEFAPGKKLSLCTRKIENTVHVETVKTALTQISFLKKSTQHPLPSSNSLQFAYELPNQQQQQQVQQQQYAPPAPYTQYTAMVSPHLFPQPLHDYPFASVSQAYSPISYSPGYTTHQPSSIEGASLPPDGKYWKENFYHLPHVFAYKETHFQS